MAPCWTPLNIPPWCILDDSQGLILVSGLPQPSGQTSVRLQSSLNFKYSFDVSVEENDLLSALKFFISFLESLNKCHLQFITLKPPVADSCPQGGVHFKGLL